MSAKIINGRYFADILLSELKQQITEVKAIKNIVPTLAIILVGNNPASSIYVRNKLKSASNVGMDVLQVNLNSEIQTEDLVAEINKLNTDNNVSGIIVQLPLPLHIDKDIILSAISFEKDVDGFHPLNVGYLHSNSNKGFVPCTALACLYLIKSFVPNLTGKNSVVIGRSNIVGKPLTALLSREDCTVTLCHSKTEDLSKITSNADIVVVAIGSPFKLTAEYFNSRCLVIDVGITRLADNKIAGDVDFKNVVNKIAYITPVPGGVGPMTITFLLKNTFQAMLNRIN